MPSVRWWLLGPSALAGLSALLLAHAIAIVLVGHCHYVVNPPSRTGWLWWELGLALVTWPLLRLLIERFLQPTILNLSASERRKLLLLSGFFGLGMAAWWTGTFADTLWLHTPVVHRLLDVVLFLSQAAVAALGATVALTIIARLALPQPPVIAESPAPTLLPIAVGVGVTLLVTNLFVIWYVGQERTIYYWDYIGYWSKATDMARSFHDEGPSTNWDLIRRGTQNDDYGPLPALIPATTATILGESRLVYILTVANSYLIILAGTVWWFLRRFLPGSGWAGVAIALSLVVLSPIVWAPLLRGYLDLGGAALGVLVLLAYLERPAGGHSWSRLVVIAALLTGMALFRRWYSFFVVAFFLVAGIDAILAAIASLRQRDWRAALQPFLGLTIIGTTAVILLATIATGWVRRVATTNYAEAYDAYKIMAATSDRAWEAFENCGLAYAGLVGLSLIIAVIDRNLRRPALFLAAMMPIMLFHFIRMQNLGPHHYCLFLPAYLVIPALGLTRLAMAVPVSVRIVGILGLVAFGIVSMASMFVPAMFQHRESLRPAISPLWFPPLVRDDLPEFRRLLIRTEEIARRSSSEGLVAAAASSWTLNGTMFMMADRSLGEALLESDRALIGGEVDRVGGFPSLYFQADVIVVAEPTQTHLRPAEQQCVIVTADSLRRGVDIGTAFEADTETFTLENGVKVRLYERVRPITPEALRAYAEKLRQAHPDRPEIHTPPPWINDWMRYPLPSRDR